MINPLPVLCLLFPLLISPVMAFGPTPESYGVELVSIPREVDEAAKFIVAENKDVPINKAVVIATAAKKSSKKYKIPKEVLMGLMHVESTFKDTSVSSKGAVGLMQVHPKTWLKQSEDGVDLISAGIVKKRSDLLDPEINIEAGTYILNHYYSEGVRLKHRNPMKYAITRYRGGKVNDHYKRTMKSVKKYKTFKENQYVTARS